MNINELRCSDKSFPQKITKRQLRNCWKEPQTSSDKLLKLEGRGVHANIGRGAMGFSIEKQFSNKNKEVDPFP